MDTQVINKNEASLNIVSITIQFVFNYIKYFFLTGLIMFSFATLLFVLININPDYQFGFFRYFSFIVPFDGKGNLYMETPEIMKIFSVMAFILMIITNLIKIILKKIFGLVYSFTTKLKIGLFFTITSLFYILALLSVFFNDSNKDFYFMFIIFYIINIVSIVGYLFMDWLLSKLNRIIIVLKK
jgi:hypothetical protein